MAESFQADQWGKVSEVLAAIYNTVRDPKKRSRPYTGKDFNPVLKPAQPKKVEITDLMKNNPNFMGAKRKV